MKKIQKPESSEYPKYASMYMKLVPDDGLVLKHLKDNFKEIKKLILSLSDEQLNFRYKKNKWSIKEILVHLVDDERIYAYRALRFARNDKTELPGFEQDDFIEFSGTESRFLSNILKEYEAVRKSTILMFESFSDEALMRTGKANGNLNSVRSLVYHIAGHELHHLNVIRKLYL